MSSWIAPEPGHAYVIGIDSASGSTSGDYCAAVVLDADTEAAVCVVREQLRPTRWGYRMAWLGWHYNEALLGFETYPSGDGLLAAHTALKAGYSNIYRRRNDSVAWREPTDDLGWHTKSATKDMMLARIDEALSVGRAIKSLPLVQELQGMRFEKSGNVEGEKTDDIVMAYGVALCVCDEGKRMGLIERKSVEPQDEASRWWRQWEKRGEMRAGRRYRALAKMYSGR